MKKSEIYEINSFLSLGIKNLTLSQLAEFNHLLDKAKKEIDNQYARKTRMER